MYILYVLESIEAKRKYIGITKNVDKRITEHNRGYVTSTKAYRPYSLIRKEQFSTKTQARKRELFLKTGRGRKELDLLLNKKHE